MTLVAFFTVLAIFNITLNEPEMSNNDSSDSINKKETDTEKKVNINSKYQCSHRYSFSCRG